MLVNTGLATIKLVAGLVGSSTRWWRTRSSRPPMSCRHSSSGAGSRSQVARRLSGTRSDTEGGVLCAAPPSPWKGSVVGGKGKGAIRRAVPQVDSVLVHMEPYEGSGPGRDSLTPSLANQ